MARPKIGSPFNLVFYIMRQYWQISILLNLPFFLLSLSRQLSFKRLWHQGCQPVRTIFPILPEFELRMFCPRRREQQAMWIIRRLRIINALLPSRKLLRPRHQTRIRYDWIHFKMSFLGFVFLLGFYSNFRPSSKSTIIKIQEDRVRVPFVIRRRGLRPI